MKITFSLIATAALMWTASSASAAETMANPISKPPAAPPPENRRPTPFEKLANDPEFKDASLFIRPGSPLAADAWQSYKNAMHFNAVKRGGGEFRDLRSVVEANARPLVDAGKPLADPVNAKPAWFRGPEESQFERLDENLTIFRFTNFAEFIKDEPEAKKAAVALGKAFFWDPRFSGSKKVACASCHYAAGTDHRTDGVVSLPVNFGAHIPWPDFRDPKFQPDQYHNAYNLKATDLVAGGAEFEGKRQAGIFDPLSIAGVKLREVIGSPGVARTQHIGSHLRMGHEEVNESLTRVKSLISKYTSAIAPRPELVTELEKVKTRLERLAGAAPTGDHLAILKRIHEIEKSHLQVTPRNSGTVVNAVFNQRNFHDSRASAVFNGHTNWGKDTKDEVNRRVFVLRDTAKTDASYQEVFTWNHLAPDGQGRNPYFIANASLASQAVEPVISDVEMSPRGRMFHHIAREMRGMKILDGQVISPSDSSLSGREGETYESLISKAFRPEWLGTKPNVKLPETAAPHDRDFYLREGAPKMGEYSQTEANFGLIWGLAIHCYISTLISDDSPFDQEQRFIKRSARPSLLDFGAPGVHQPQPYDPGEKHPPEARPTVRPAVLTGQAPNTAAVQPLSPEARRGRELFRTMGCIECHSGAEFTSASWSELGLFNSKGDPFAVPAEPLLPTDNLDDEVDIVAGELVCAPEKPIGVECMDFNGRMQSLYDGGNYVIGASRFLRPDLAPDSPLISEKNPESPVFSGIDLLITPAQPADTVWYEDSGIGRYFLPPETNLPPGAPVGDFVVTHWKAALKRNRQAVELLKRSLGVPLTEPSTFLAPGTDEKRAFTFLQLGEGTVPAGLSPATNLVREAEVLKQRIDILAPEVDRQVFNTLSPLNSTQQLRTQELREAPDEPAPLVQPAVPFEERVIAEEFARNFHFVPIAFPGQTSPWLVGPMTPTPEFSRSRAWVNGFNEDLLVAYETRLQEAIAAGSEALADQLRAQIRATDYLIKNKHRERVADAGAFKAPTLRNVELTGPYMHNGTLLTLEAVLDFYERGGHFNGRVKANEEDFKTGDLHPEMVPIPMSTEQKADLIAFLKSLTDKRVSKGAAPFDHPSLDIPLEAAAGTEPLRIMATGREGGREVKSFEDVLLSK